MFPIPAELWYKEDIMGRFCIIRLGGKGSEAFD